MKRTDAAGKARGGETVSRPARETQLAPNGRTPKEAQGGPNGRSSDHALPVPLDDLDRKLILLLRANGRATNRELARLTNVTQVTVANRIRRLVDERIVRIVAVPTPERLGYPLEVIIGIHADVSRIREVAAALCLLPEVRFVTITSGAYDLVITALLRGSADLLAFLADKVASIEGVQKLETSHALQVLKRNPDWIPFAEDFDGLGGPYDEDGE